MACTKCAKKVAKGKFLATKLVMALVALTVIAPVLAHDVAPWPQIPLPKQVDVFEVGNEMIVNGMPIRMQGFVSRASPAELAASMRQLLGAPLMEDRRGATLVLGRGQGRYYITVQLAPLGSGTRALIAVTKPPLNAQDPVAVADARHLLSALPPGSTLTSQTASFDGPVRAHQAAIVNSHSVDINTEYVKRMLRAEGFTLEREAMPAQGLRTRASAPPGARTMFFKRAGAEAIAVVARDERGNSVIVLNRVNSAEHGK
jgi:hypothetical protein